MNHFPIQNLSLPRSRLLLSLAALCSLLLLASCATQRPIPGTAHEAIRGTQPESTLNAQGPRIQPSTSSSKVPLATTSSGGVITLADIQTQLLEAQGRAIAEEVALDRALARELKAKSLTIHDHDLDREEQELLQNVARGARTDADEAQRLILQIRRERGLGPARYRALLLRNAALRALVAPEIDITPAEIEREQSLRASPRVHARVIITRTREQASDLRRRLESTPTEERATRFAELAAAYSTDASATNAGQLEPFALEDPAVPAVLRNLLQGLNPGDLTPLFILDSTVGFALFEGTNTAPAAAPSTEDIIREFRTKYERIAMDRLAKDLLATEHLTPTDPSIRW
ncbi:MAG: peptidylprolyl isomerase [Phycisphaerales bacterium]